MEVRFLLRSEEGVQLVRQGGGCIRKRELQVQRIEGR